MTNTAEIEKINNVIWEFLTSEIHSLGEVILDPERYDKSTITAKLGYADNTSLLIDSLKANDVPIDPLLTDGRELLNFLYNAVNIHKFEDAKTLINNTSLWRIVRFTSPAAKITIFPKDAIIILKDFLRKEFVKTI